MQRLRAMGVALTSDRRGYRLQQPLELLDAQAIQRALEPRARTLLSCLQVHLSIDSTNDELLRHAANLPSGSVCLAEYQAHGRGRRGRDWHSPLGANLYASVLWRFPAGLASLSGLSVAMGVALVRACGHLGAATQIKWPNDLLAAGRKLAGILIEAGGEWSGPCHAVIGIGLNHRMPAAEGTHIAQDWTDLATLCGAPAPTRAQACVQLLNEVLVALAEFEQHGLSPFLGGFARADALRGRTVQVHAGGEPWSGVAQGIDAQGSLRVRRADGAVIALSGAEVSIRAAASQG